MFFLVWQLGTSVVVQSLDFQRRPDAMPSMAHPALGTSHSVTHFTYCQAHPALFRRGGAFVKTAVSYDM